MAAPEEPLAAVALLLVSHSRALAQGTVELAAQMAPNVLLVDAGGLPDGGLGTSFDGISAGLDEAAGNGRSVVVLTDLGSALLTTESVLEFAADDVAARVRLADAPFVEGAVAAAVSAAGNAGLEGVLAAAEKAGAGFAGSRPAAPAAVGATDPGVGRAPVPVLRASAVLRNPLGLHARPAAQLARTAASFDAAVTVNGVDGASVLELIGLGAVGGQPLAVTASGPQARAALSAVVAEIEEGFGEA
ncbi:dihydroxyacetone kinase phosphoryl donor subunit DhaM [Pengzhenrongella sicca]|uniref:dihydroxyacetone kinase phosphoryl donor subunit DhaM n=1 Tax=Pengzhenrongella sicca TaxID=2819238 RepID=UPI001D0CBDEA|nr:dihydroxyacetone kinase phosphoryl donor subunit DhaM [Pengzhenrongella sicca]